MRSSGTIFRVRGQVAEIFSKSAPDAKQTTARLDTWRGFATKYGVDYRGNFTGFYGTAHYLRSAMADTSAINVTVVHGDLRHANYPLALGHYSRDVIVNAEAALDSALGGVLRQRFDLGIYAGDIGTSE